MSQSELSIVLITLSDWASIATIIGAVIAVGALVYTAQQVHFNTKVNRASFWLELRKMFAEHREVHLKLRNLEWSAAAPTDDDWAKLEAYMGLFEHCELMLKEGLIDATTFTAIYAYRLENILDDNLIVREKLIDRRLGWTQFIQLLNRMGDSVPRRRYLYGYWDVDERKWKLWWGVPQLEEGQSFHDNHTELEAAYDAKLSELLGLPLKLHHGCLIGPAGIKKYYLATQEAPITSPPQSPPASPPAAPVLLPP